jgi:CBS domain containing-hemolysin-like protein
MNHSHSPVADSFSYFVIRSLRSFLCIVLKPFGLNWGRQLQREEAIAALSGILASGEEEQAIAEDEAEMVMGVMGLSQTVAREIMTPRRDLICIPADSSLTEVINIIRESGFSRFPVQGETVDDIIGILLARDVLSFELPELIRIGADAANNQFSVKKLLREAYFVDGNKPINELLQEFKRRKLHLAVVLDEHGGIDGVVTLEDLLEEIVGDIFDESDIPERTVEVLANGDIVVDGGQLVADLNTEFELNIPEGQYDTIAGYIFTRLGRMPKPGDEISIFDENIKESEVAGEAASPTELIRIRVDQVQSYRIEKVTIRPLTNPEKA